MKPYFLVLHLVLSVFCLKAQNITVQPVELSIKKPDINRQYEETELAISIRNIGQEFLMVKEFKFSLTDDKGTDLVEKNRANLQVYEKKGFYTSRATDWEYFNYAFYNQKDAFGGKLIVYSAPAVDAKQLVLRGEVQVWVKNEKSNTRQVGLNNIVIRTDSVYHAGDVSVRFVENGSLSLDNRKYKNYKVVSQMPLAAIEVVGQKKFNDIPAHPNDFFVPEGQKEISLLLHVPESRLLTIPVHLNFGIGF